MLSEKQRKAAALLSGGISDSEQLAKAVGVSMGIMEKWKNDAGFLQEVENRRREFLNAAAARAVQTLMEIMLRSDGEKERLSAAKEILNHAEKPRRDELPENDAVLQVTVCYGDRANHGD